MESRITKLLTVLNDNSSRRTFYEKREIETVQAQIEADEIILKNPSDSEIESLIALTQNKNSPSKIAITLQGDTLEIFSHFIKLASNVLTDCQHDAKTDPPREREISLTIDNIKTEKEDLIVCTPEFLTAITAILNTEKVLKNSKLRLLLPCDCQALEESLILLISAIPNCPDNFLLEMPELQNAMPFHGTQFATIVEHGSCPQNLKFLLPLHHDTAMLKQAFKKHPQLKGIHLLWDDQVFNTKTTAINPDEKIIAETPADEKQDGQSVSPALASMTGLIEILQSDDCLSGFHVNFVLHNDILKELLPNANLLFQKPFSSFSSLELTIKLKYDHNFFPILQGTIDLLHGCQFLPAKMMLTLAAPGSWQDFNGMNLAAFILSEKCPSTFTLTLPWGNVKMGIYIAIFSALISKRDGKNFILNFKEYYPEFDDHAIRARQIPQFHESLYTLMKHNPYLNLSVNFIGCSPDELEHWSRESFRKILGSVKPTQEIDLHCYEIQDDNLWRKNIVEKTNLQNTAGKIAPQYAVLLQLLKQKTLLQKLPLTVLAYIIALNSRSYSTLIRGGFFNKIEQRLRNIHAEIVAKEDAEEDKAYILPALIRNLNS